MPREWGEDASGGSSEPIDLCNDCYYDVDISVRGDSNCHPEYDGEEYDCESCGKRLTNEDN